MTSGIWLRLKPGTIPDQLETSEPHTLHIPKRRRSYFWSSSCSVRWSKLIRVDSLTFACVQIIILSDLSDSKFRVSQPFGRGASIDLSEIKDTLRMIPPAAMDTDAITCRVNETSLVIRRDDRNEPCTFCLENPCEPWVYNLKKQLGPVTDQEVEQPGKLLLRSSWDVQTIFWKYYWCLFANIPFSKNPVQTSSVNWSWKSTFHMFLFKQHGTRSAPDSARTARLANAGPDATSPWWMQSREELYNWCKRSQRIWIFLSFICILWPHQCNDWQTQCTTREVRNSWIRAVFMYQKKVAEVCNW